VREGGRFRSLAAVPWEWAERWGTLPCALSAAERQRLANLRFAPLAVGDVCRTVRGLGVQRRLAAKGDVPVVGGRDLERWRVRSCSGFLPAAEAPDFAGPRLFFQNIIAHVRRPVPHIRLIGACADGGTLSLDTINILMAREANVRLPAILALLHSRLVNWLVYALVYNKAIRTMHFDQYFLDKVPLPHGFERVQDRLAALARDCTDLTAALAEAPAAAAGTRLRRQRERCEREIDRLVASAYGAPGRRAGR
jgi:hypothetical protein